MLSTQWATFDECQKTGCMVVSMQILPFINEDVRGWSIQISRQVSVCVCKILCSYIARVLFIPYKKHFKGNFKTPYYYHLYCPSIGEGFSHSHILLFVFYCILNKSYFKMQDSLLELSISTEMFSLLAGSHFIMLGAAEIIVAWYYYFYSQHLISYNLSYEGTGSMWMFHES